ncbi:BatD family protein [Mucilaginibacter sp. dw_454]|uniref:BatD family protein n=1 Tax=Mucilaginibacter sp. dw_454 TaxID=2720079 RepID=UPI001BD6D967|nr:BatD family protein [Mucilaginibacter sp. dw_454]
MKIKHYILTLLLFAAAPVFAQDGKFVATASQTTVSTGEQFQITFSISGEGNNFNPPDLVDFQLLSGPNVSNSMEFINGKATSSSSVSYILAPMRVGTFTIGSASVVVNGKKLSSNPIKITVIKRKATQQNNGGNVTGADQTQGNNVDLSKLLFLRSDIDKNNVYQGQPIVLTYRIFTRVDILQNQTNKMPDLTGFWNEDVKQTQPAQFRIGTYKGERYNIADLKQIILFPEHAGNITIDPFEMTFLARVQSSPRDFMDQFFGGNTQEINYPAKSLPVVVHVKPLPEAGKPTGFAGAVGKFNIEASIDKDHLKANEPINYKIKISGFGNIKLLKDLSPNFPADFEKYDPKITDTVTQNAYGSAGNRIYNYLIIPRHKGDYTIDPVKFSYFNPATGRYVSLTTRGFKIKVEKGLHEENVTAISGDNQEDVKLLSKDIRYIKTGSPELRDTGEGFFGSAGFYLLLLLGPLLCVGAFAYRNQMRRNNADIVNVKSRRAGKVAAKHLAIANKELQTNNTHAFYEAVFKGLYGYLSDKLNISYADLDRETIAAALRARSVKEETTNELLDTLDLCEMARYAPVTHISAQQVFDKAKGSINAIEDEI